MPCLIGQLDTKPPKANEQSKDEKEKGEKSEKGILSLIAIILSCRGGCGPWAAIATTATEGVAIVYQIDSPSLRPLHITIVLVTPVPYWLISNINIS